MHRLQVHLPSWMHADKSNWHTLRVHLSHMLHDPRFWAALALIILFGLMIITTLMTKPALVPGPTPTHPIYPYLP